MQDEIIFTHFREQCFNTNDQQAAVLVHFHAWGRRMGTGFSATAGEQNNPNDYIGTPHTPRKILEVAIRMQRE